MLFRLCINQLLEETRMTKEYILWKKIAKISNYASCTKHIWSDPNSSNSQTINRILWNEKKYSCNCRRASEKLELSAQSAKAISAVPILLTFALTVHKSVFLNTVTLIKIKRQCFFNFLTKYSNIIEKRINFYYLIKEWKKDIIFIEKDFF